MRGPSDTDKLAALGYEHAPAGIRRFQADFNRLGPEQPLAVDGQLDANTREALELAYQARAMLELSRGGER